jgi:hypothetical protein
MRGAGIAVRVQNRRNQVCFRTIPVFARSEVQSAHDAVAE